MMAFPRKASWVPAAASLAVTLVGPRIWARFLPPSVQKHWERENYSGGTVTLAEGPIIVSALGTGLALTASGTAAPVIAAGLAGVADDLWGGHDAKGLRGHFRSLAAGKITTGVGKVAIISLAALGFAYQQNKPYAHARSWTHMVADATLLAGTTNLVNLLDLRPGRALKSAVIGAAGAHNQTATIIGAVAGGVAGKDLRAESMMGDSGANALGMAVGIAWQQRLRPSARICLALAVSAANIASEKVSFSQVIANNRVLRAMDQWGRATHG